MSKTSDAVEILRRRYGQTPEAEQSREEERIKSLAALAIYQARTTAGLTQKQLADLVGTKQPVIARLEDADYEGHTITMLSRIAHALGMRLDLRFEPLESASMFVESEDSEADSVECRPARRPSRRERAGTTS
jgi:transcriptional regulator with XRE-family HTH domain